MNTVERVAQIKRARPQGVALATAEREPIEPASAAARGGEPDGGEGLAKRKGCRREMRSEESAEQSRRGSKVKPLLSDEHFSVNGMHVVNESPM
jgi:hypothetical protein